MQKNIIIAVVIIILLVLSGGGYYLYTDAVEQEKIAEAKVKQEQLALEQKRLAEEAEMKRLKCVDGDNFSVVTRDRKDQAGQDVLVKAKGASAGQCAYAVTEGDFDLTNADPQFYKAQIASSLVTDIGTGPSGRKLRIYDLKDKSLITEKDYFGDLEIASGTLAYFGLSKTKADAKNCKEYATLMKDFNNANLVVKKIVDLETFLVKETKETKCVANQ